MTNCGPKIVYAYVVADLLHIGHVRFLEEAKKQGDYLIVGVLSDNATMEKKPKPVLDLMHRVCMVESLKCVDKVITQWEYSPLNRVKELKPNILIESDSHSEQPANDFVKSYGGKVIVIPYFTGISSTKIKEQIRKA